MQSYGRRFAQRPIRSLVPFGLSSLLALMLAGCASPGAPRPPSLQLPKLPPDFAASRAGNEVQLQFTVPDRTTDGLPLRGDVLHGTVCRQTMPHGPCQLLPLPQASIPLQIGATSTSRPAVVWTDPLSPELASGPARLISYRLRLSNHEGRSAGYSDPVFAAAGAAPPPVTSLHAEGTRLGVLLGWTPAPGAGEVLLERQQVDPPPVATPTRPIRTNPVERRLRAQAASPSVGKAQNGVLWLQAEPGNNGSAQTLDGAVTEHFRYRYVAVRRVQAELSGEVLELRSAPSAPAEITWNDVYPPPSPQQLTAVGFQTPPGQAEGQASPSFAVDLIWEPVRDPRVTGYLVRRVAVAPAGANQGEAVLLTAEPLPAPAFHDTTARPDQKYRYEVTAIDIKGNRSAPAVTMLVPTLP